MAINVAHQLRQMEIPVYFISLRGMKSKDDLVSKLLSIFADAKQAFHVSPSHWLIKCLQQLANPFVLMLDNADDLLESGDSRLKEDVVGFTEEILAQCNHVKLLFTTRESLDYLRQKHLIHLERVAVLDEDSSGELVRLLLPYVSENDCSRIVKKCGQVPLAMRLMCSIMNEENISVNELLEELKISPLVEVLDNESFLDNFRLKTIINTSFQRLTDHEKYAFVSLAVFPGYFGIREASAVLELKTDRQNKKVMRSLERKSLIECSENFTSFTIHSLLRSFIVDKITTDQQSGAIYFSAQRRFYKFYISYFEDANRRFFSGHSNEALESFLSRPERIILSLCNGTRDDELYSRTVDILSKAELFLYSILPANEVLFNTIYDTAVKEARKRQNMADERKLLAAKSFNHWGWFSVDRYTWDHSLQPGYTDAADWPAKFLCYFGIHQILCGKLDEGISSLKRSVDRLSSCCDETVLKQLVYQVLAVSLWKKQDYKMVSSFQDLCRIEAKAGSACVGCLFFHPSDTWLPFKSDTFLFFVTHALLCLSAKRESTDVGAFHNMGEVIMMVCSGRIELFSEAPLKQAFATWQLIGRELKELNLVSDKEAVALEPLFSFDMFNDQCLEDSYCYNQLLPVVEHAISSGGEFVRLLVSDLVAAILKEFKEVESALEFNGDALDEFAGMYDRLGKLLHVINDYSKAMELYQHAIALRNKNIGDHVDTASSLTNIGCVYFKLGNEKEAVKSFQSALELRKQLAIYDHVDTANIYYTLGENHFSLGNYDKAIEAHLKALELRKKHLGEHPLTGESLHHIAVAYSVKGIQNQPETFLQLESCKEALTFCQQALAMRLILLSEHVDTANSFHLLGTVVYNVGDLPSAVEAFQKASNMRLTLLGDHEDTVQSYNWLALAQYKMGDLHGAVESLTKCWQNGTEILKDDPSRANFDNEFQDVQDEVDKYEQRFDVEKNEAARCHELAQTNLLTGSFSEALRFCQQALTIRLEILETCETLPTRSTI